MAGVRRSKIPVVGNPWRFLVTDLSALSIVALAPCEPIPVC